MKINHDKTKNLIIDIAELLKAQAVTANKYKTDSVAITSDKRTSRDYQEEQINNLRTAYLAKHKETEEKVVEKLNEILPIELENEKILEFDVPEFSNTLAAINSTQGKLPSDVIEGIKLNFAGQYQALLTIKSAFERYGVELKPYNYEEFTTSAGFQIRSLITEAGNIEQSEVSTLISLNNLLKAVIRFGEVRGIIFDDSLKQFPYYEEVSDYTARKVMGLS